MIVTTQQREVLEDGDNLVKQIELRGRICYKSESKITKGSAKKFVKFAIDKKHNTVLEMAKITLAVRLPAAAVAFTNELYSSLPKYITVDLDVGPKGGAILLITATVRGFREWIMKNHKQAVANAVSEFLAEKEPLLFGGLPETPPCYPGISVDQVVVGTDNLNLFMRHTWVAVKFTTNRAVTHEIVRHRPVSFLQESQRYCRYDDEVVFIEPTAFNFNEKDRANWETAMLSAEALYLKLLENNSPQAARTVLPNSCKTEIIVYCNLREWSHIFCQRTSPHAEPSMVESMVPVLSKFQEMFPMCFDKLQLSIG